VSPAAPPAQATASARARRRYPHPATRASPVWRLVPVLLAALGAAAFLAVDPRVADLPAGEFRGELFGREGLTLWNNAWYAGHHTLGYSVLLPPLVWLLGSPVAVGVVSALACAALFEPLARAHFGEGARYGTALLGAGTASLLFTGRIAFAAGAAIGLGALLALQRGRPGLAAALAAACSLTSPVAGVFLGLAGTALALAGRRREGAWMAIFALIPPAALALAFPTGGSHPFVTSSFLPTLILAGLFLAVVPARERVLRAGAVLYALAASGSYLIDTPFGGNVVRLGQLFGAGVLACVLATHDPGRARRLAGAALLGALLVWQWHTPYIELKRLVGNRSVESRYYAPLLEFLDRQGGEPWRVEIPPTRNHWETAEVAPRFPLARGWERQLDIRHNGLFYDGGFDAERYRRWLTEHGVRFVALPDALLDRSAHDERRLIESRPPYLVERWRSEHWRVYEVALPRPLAIPRPGERARLAQLGSDSFVVDFREPGEALARVHWSPHWWAGGACVEREGEWTRVSTTRPGLVRVAIRFSPERVWERGRRCG
jgi:hypothetical protein